MKTHMSIKKAKKLLKKHYFDLDPVGTRKVIWHRKDDGAVEIHFRSSKEQIYHPRKKLAAREAALNKIREERVCE